MTTQTAKDIKTACSVQDCTLTVSNGNYTMGDGNTLKIRDEYIAIEQHDPIDDTTSLVKMWSKSDVKELASILSAWASR